jgi:hypothetical protein
MDTRSSAREKPPQPLSSTIVTARALRTITPEPGKSQIFIEIQPKIRILCSAAFRL